MWRSVVASMHDTRLQPRLPEGGGHLPRSAFGIDCPRRASSADDALFGFPLTPPMVMRGRCRTLPVVAAGHVAAERIFAVVAGHVEQLPNLESAALLAFRSAAGFTRSGSACSPRATTSCTRSSTSSARGSGVRSTWSPRGSSQ